jgi:hypothetical protein
VDKFGTYFIIKKGLCHLYYHIGIILNVSSIYTISEVIFFLSLGSMLSYGMWPTKAYLTEENSNNIKIKVLDKVQEIKS